MVTWGSPQNWKNKESINPNGCWIRLVPCRNHMFISTSIVVYPAISSTSHRKATSHQARPPNGLLEEIAKIFLAIFSSAANVTMAIFSWSIFILDRWVWLMKFRWLMADFEVWNNCRVCRVWVSNFENPDLVTVLGTNLPNLRDILPSKGKLEPDSNGTSKYPKTAIGGKIIGLLYPSL